MTSNQVYLPHNCPRPRRTGLRWLALPLACGWALLWALLWSPWVQAQEQGLHVELPNAIALPGYGLALDREVVTLGDNCPSPTPNLRRIGQPVSNFLGSEQTLIRYQIIDTTPITELIGQSNSRCRLLPNYLLAMSGTNSVFGSPFDNPNNAEPNPANITQARVLLNQPTSGPTGAGITIAVFDSYCPATSTALASDLFLQTMGVTGLVVQPSFTISVPMSATPPIATQCSHNEAVISLAKTIAPAARVELWPVLNAHGLGALTGLLQALHAFYQTMASNQQPYIINLSLGVLGDLKDIEAILQRLAGPGRIVIAAAGNWRAIPNPPIPPDAAQAPAAFQHSVLAVHATDNTGVRTAYSNLGAIGAPGGLDGCTTDGAGQPTAACLPFFNSRSATKASGWKGTSYATALTTGVVALLLEQDSTRNLATVRRLLWCGARGPDRLIDVALTLAGCDQQADLGDAPDGVNYAGLAMRTYPAAILATFPTIYSDPVAPLGPIHWRPSANSWLGRLVSTEREADQFPDSDGLTNLDLQANLANRDGADDGVLLSTLNLPECATTRFQYAVTVRAKEVVRYVNVWFDYNRDGDWADSVICTQNGVRYRVWEWAVRNQTVPATLGLGYRLRNTPAFRTTHAPTTTNPLWMRITLSDEKAPLIPSKTIADGRGPTAGYRFGETEDYLLNGVPATMAQTAWIDGALADDTADGSAFDGTNDEQLGEETPAPTGVNHYYLPLLTR